MTLEEFIDCYRVNNRFPYPLKNWSKKPLSDTELRRKYNEYLRTLENNKCKKSVMKKRSYSNKVRKAMESSKSHKRWDDFYRTLTKDEKKAVDDTMWMCPRDSTGMVVFDTAHIVSRSSSYSLASDIDNMIELPRGFHSYIDDYKNPLSNEHEHISKEEHDSIWIRLVGKELWEKINDRN